MSAADGARSAVDGAAAARSGKPDMRPVWPGRTSGCPCGCSSAGAYVDPECLRLVTDHAELYRRASQRQRDAEGRFTTCTARLTAA